MTWSRIRRGQGDDGASSAEYALLIAGIAAVIVLAVFFIGGSVRNAFSDTCQSWASAQGGTC